ncbi:MAG: succinate dehydrogenase cytochrome b subunit [Deltaproteobacteria bacterium]|nr:succinate dehydrogenase cytochrome b subunit [Deltaproteobacteria bacterium]
MLPLKKIVTSSVGKKYVMGLSGLGLVFFVIMHLLGNLALLRSNGNAFNEYADALGTLDWILRVLEVGLFGTILVHVFFALRLAVVNHQARPQRYTMARSKKGPSRWNLSSMHMVVTGVVLGAFLVLHVLQFQYGPGIAEGYVTEVKGKQMRDLYRLVNETFHNPYVVVIYVFTMLMLGFHLRHGFWSAFQSLGQAYPRVSKPLYAVGVALAILLSVGFLILPLWLYFDVPARLLAGGGVP